MWGKYLKGYTYLTVKNVLLIWVRQCYYYIAKLQKKIDELHRLRIKTGIFLTNQEDNLSIFHEKSS